jgi:hypothetical protein
MQASLNLLQISGDLHPINWMASLRVWYPLLRDPLSCLLITNFWRFASHQLDGFPSGLTSIIEGSSLLFGSCFFWCLVYSFMLVDSSGNANNRHCCLSWTLCIKIETITMLKGYRIRKYYPLKDENNFFKNIITKWWPFQ